jgi:hypothetical protein
VWSLMACPAQSRGFTIAHGHPPMATDLDAWQVDALPWMTLACREFGRRIRQLPKYAPKSRRPGGKSLVIAALGVVCKTVVPMTSGPARRLVG